MRVIDNAAQVALELADVDRIEPDERGEQADICLGQLVTEQVSAVVVRRSSQSVQRIEQRSDRFLVGVLRGRKPGAINAVVEVS